MEEPTTHEIATLWRLNGERYEKHGENLAAAMSYEKASKALSYEGDEALGYLNQAAINYRLAGDGRFDDPYWVKAHELFDRVIANAQASELRNRARRDKAMLYVEEERYDEAEKLLSVARGEYDASNNWVEFWCTWGFEARVFYAQGKHALAREHLHSADHGLRGQHDLYELNNLVWRMKVVNPIHRQLLLCRALRLAVRTGYRRRAAEALLIAISPRLYERVLRAKRG